MFKKHKFKFIFIIVMYCIASVFIHLNNYSSISIFNPPKQLSNPTSIVETLAVSGSTGSSLKVLTTTDAAFGIQDITIGVPSSDTNPIAILLHDDVNLSYLITHLADNGYLTISIDISSTFINNTTSIDSALLNTLFTNQIKNIVEEVDNPASELYNKAEFSEVSLFGIGTGGLGAYYLTISPPDTSLLNLSSTLLVAPNLSSLQDKTTTPDTPIGIILPQYDGLVRSLDGQMLFDLWAFSDELTAPISCVYLLNANHNYFSDVYDFDDSLNVPYSTDNPNRLIQSDQQKFLTNYTLDFFEYYNSGNNITNIGLDTGVIAPNTMYGLDVLTSLSTPDSLPIISAVGTISESFNELGGTNNMNNASISYITESYIASYDEAYGFQHPGLPENLGLLKFSWTVDTGTLTTTIPAQYKDFSGYSSLSFWIALDVANNLNSLEYQSIIISLKDSSGNIEHVLLDENSVALTMRK
ncbi:MAG: hypothetical protein ATN35_09635 [Epulopiscium sp. Nele67-Bin004]|nr:MAG: hypothetical protein ATN35_09635 [Epulopiscium sp. Nele67-Bin004]